VVRSRNGPEELANGRESTGKVTLVAARTAANDGPRDGARHPATNGTSHPVRYPVTGATSPSVANRYREQREVDSGRHRKRE
jgi:hypothetical protein